MLSILSKSTDINSFINIVKSTYFNDKDYTSITGKIGEELCKFYFLFNSRLFNIKNYYTRDNLPEYIRLKLKLDEKDRGTDGIIEHNNGKFSFVQCKYRTDINSTLDRSSVANMALECLFSKDILQDLYLFCTVLKEPTELSKNERLNIKFILYGELENLNWTLFKQFVSNYSEKEQKELINFNNLPKLYEHQKLALNISKNQDKLTIIVACGGGKSLISYLLFVREINDHNCHVLLLVPSLYLMSQAFRDFSLYSDIPKLLIGSDYNEDNYKFPYTLTTDEKEIELFIGNNIKSILISTYQSCNKLYNALKSNKIVLGLTIADEAHLTATNKQDSCYNLVLKDEFPSKKKIFMTGTPKIYKGKNDECYSMDNENLYGKTYNILSYRQAIEQKILCDYKLMLGVGTNTENLKVKGIKDKVGNELNISSREYILLNMIIKDLEEEYSRIIVCSSNHKNSKNFYNFCKEMIKDVKLMLMPENATSKQKDRAQKLIKTEKKCVIFQVRIFNLGVNINEITTIALLDDKNSTIDIVQTISRALRIHKTKENARMLIPVVINERKENEFIYDKEKDEFNVIIQENKNFFDTNEFNNVKNILSSIALYDEANKRRDINFNETL